MRSFEENIGEIRRLPWPEAVRPAHAGLLGFPARLLGGLPVPVCIEVVDRAGRTLVLATGAEEAAQLRERGATVIDAEECSALAEGAESDRVFEADLAVLVTLRGPGRITAELALAGARADPPRGWSVGTVLGRLGLEPRLVGTGLDVANGEPRSVEPARRAA